MNLLVKLKWQKSYNLKIKDLKTVIGFKYNVLYIVLQLSYMKVSHVTLTIF